MLSFLRPKPTTLRQAAGPAPEVRSARTLSDLAPLTEWAERAVPLLIEHNNMSDASWCKCGRRATLCRARLAAQLAGMDSSFTETYLKGLRGHADAVRKLGQPAKLVVERELLLRSVSALLELLELRNHSEADVTSCKEALARVYSHSQLVAAGVESLPGLHSLYSEAGPVGESPAQYQARLDAVRAANPVSVQLAADVAELEVRKAALKEAATLLAELLSWVASRHREVNALVAAMDEAEAFVQGRGQLDLARSNRSDRAASSGSLALLTRLQEPSPVTRELENVRSAVERTRERLRELPAQ